MMSSTPHHHGSLLFVDHRVHAYVALAGRLFEHGG
jgi:hypothetical protein